MSNNRVLNFFGTNQEELKSLIEGRLSKTDALRLIQRISMTPQTLIIGGLVPLCLGVLFSAPLSFNLSCLLATVIGVTLFVRKDDDQRLAGTHGAGKYAPFVFVGDDISTAAFVGTYHGRLDNLVGDHLNVRTFRIPQHGTIAATVSVIDRLSFVLFGRCPDVHVVRRVCRLDRGGEIVRLDPPASSGSTATDDRDGAASADICPVCSRSAATCASGFWWEHLDDKAAVVTCRESDVISAT